ncbi:MAG: hypothetical protein EOO77_22150 [Oxalobacteraceae bacterium]|nr:MAG: hypothetical protein EOO77_22150 [Oxalobacteraceae bacterium]
MKVLLTLALATAGHAGPFRDWCIGLMVADDPYQFETADTVWVTRQLEALCVRKRWRALDHADQRLFDLLNAELGRRAAWGTEADRELADLTLIRCAQ